MSVKRISLQEFKKVSDNTLTELLGIASITVMMFAMLREGEHDVLHLWCTHIEEVALCPHCGSLSTTIHQENPRCIRHLDVWGKKTFLHFLSRSFKCEDCGRTFVEELTFVDPHRRQSIAFQQHVYKACQTKTRKAVAVREGLSHSTVKDIFNFWAGMEHTITDAYPVRVLGIDELSIKKRHK